MSVLEETIDQGCMNPLALCAEYTPCGGLQKQTPRETGAWRGRLMAAGKACVERWTMSVLGMCQNRGALYHGSFLVDFRSKLTRYPRVFQGSVPCTSACSGPGQFGIASAVRCWLGNPTRQAVSCFGRSQHVSLRPKGRS